MVDGADLPFVSLLLLGLLLFLLFGGSRVGAAGKGLGEAARHIKRAVREDREPEPSAPPAPPMIESPQSTPPKLLPAKGETGKLMPDDEA